MPASTPHPAPLASGQIRAARALLRWSAEDLARASAVGVATIRRAELTDDETALTAANDLAIRRALEAAGVEFIDGGGGGPGARFRKAGPIEHNTGSKRPRAAPKQKR
jgi:transcriptional regulator with XRE-family HTH domain